MKRVLSFHPAILPVGCLLFWTGCSVAFQILTPPATWRVAGPPLSAPRTRPIPSREFLISRDWRLKEKENDVESVASDDDDRFSKKKTDDMAGGPTITATATNDGDKDDMDLSPEEEYRKRLEEAQAAFAKAEEARQKLLQQQQKEKVPANDETLVLTDIVNVDDAPKLKVYENDMAVLSPFSRAELSYTDAQTLEIVLPPQNMGMNTLLTSAFSVAWFSAITPATFAARGLASLMFMLPFWIAGATVAKAGVVDPLVRQKFTLGQYAWSLTKEIAGQTIQKVERPTERLRGVQLRLIDYVNEVPRYELQLQLSGSYDNKNNDYSFGLWVGEQNLNEARELLEVINRQLKKLEAME